MITLENYNFYDKLNDANAEFYSRSEYLSVNRVGAI